MKRDPQLTEEGQRQYEAAFLVWVVEHYLRGATVSAFLHWGVRRSDVLAVLRICAMERAGRKHGMSVVKCPPRPRDFWGVK